MSEADQNETASEPTEMHSTNADQQSASPAKGNVELDDRNVETLYANLCRVASTPEEVILDLGLDPNPLSTAARRVPISHRVILNHYTAKRLAALLLATVQHHEKIFGPLETDYRKRVQSTESGPPGHSPPHAEK